MTAAGLRIDARIKQKTADYMWRDIMKKRTPAEILANLKNYDKEIEPCYKMAPEEVESLIEILENTKGWLYKYDGHQDLDSTYNGAECLFIDRTTGDLFIDKCDVYNGLFWNDKLDKKRYKVIAWRKS